MQNNDEEVLYESASGGAFTALAETVLCKGGVAYGASYTDSFEVTHKGVDKSKI